MARGFDPPEAPAQDGGTGLAPGSRPARADPDGSVAEGVLVCAAWGIPKPSPKGVSLGPGISGRILAGFRHRSQLVEHGPFPSPIFDNSAPHPRSAPNEPGLRPRRRTNPSPSPPRPPPARPTPQGLAAGLVRRTKPIRDAMEATVKPRVLRRRPPTPRWQSGQHPWRVRSLVGRRSRRPLGAGPERRAERTQTPAQTPSSKPTSVWPVRPPPFRPAWPDPRSTIDGAGGPERERVLPERTHRRIAAKC
jgi:hypothetical protein